MNNPATTHLQVDEDLLKLQEKGRRLLKALQEIATELDKVRFGSNVSKVVGSSAAVAGTVVSVVGGILSFFTFGASLILVIVGSSVAAAGGLTTTGAFIADKVISKKKMQQAEKLYEEYLNDPHVARLLATDHTNKEDTTDGECPDAQTTAGISLALGRIARMADCIADTASPAGSALRVTTTAGRTLVIAGLVVDTILLPLTIYDLVTSSLELHRKKGHPGGEGVRNFIDLIQLVDHTITHYTILSMDSTDDLKKAGGM